MKRAVLGALLAAAMAVPAFANDDNEGSREAQVYAPHVAAPQYAAPPAAPCPGCVAPRPHYDSQEVINTTRTIDRSGVINTQTVIPVAPQKREINHLVIRNHQTRHVGVIQHNHTIIEKEIRLVKRDRGYHAYARPPATVINFVTHKYRVVERPSTYQRDTTVVYGPGRDCKYCAPPRVTRTKYRGPLRVRG